MKKHPIEKLCEELNITRYTLSKSSGVSQSTINYQIRNDVNPFKISYENFKKLAYGFKMTPEELDEKLTSYLTNEDEGVKHQGRFMNGILWENNNSL